MNMNYSAILKDIKAQQKIGLRENSMRDLQKEAAEVYGIKDSSPSKKTFQEKHFEH